MKEKKKKRSPYSFANINLLGKCNLDCRFCLGKDLEEEFNKYNCMDTHYLGFKNLSKYLKVVWDKGIRQIYITGQNTDPLIYPYIKEFINFIKGWGFACGIRTNGIMAKELINIVNDCTTVKGDAVAYTVLTRNKEIMFSLTNRKIIPDWDWLFRNTTVPYRVSIVVTQDNRNEVLDLIGFISKYKFFNANLRYCQIRKVSTEYRKQELSLDIEAFGEVATEIRTMFPQKTEYEQAEVFDIAGLDIVLWKTVDTTANSMNYFTNGVISDEYFIIKGYERHKELT